MRRTKAVALLIEELNSDARSLLKGIASYVHENELWSIYRDNPGENERMSAWLETWQGDGIIARVENESLARSLQELDIPVVDVSRARQIPERLSVEVNEYAVAKMALDHLRERGFKSLAVCAPPASPWARVRQQAFMRQVAEAGLECVCFAAASADAQDCGTASDRADLVSWLESLPRSTGLFCVDDETARHVLDVCREIGIEVPEQIAVLGVGNDEVICALCTPPLSSVIPPGTRIGYEAARLLECLMHGEEIESTNLLLDPLGVAARQSTDVLAIEDDDVATAVRFIRDHHCERINVHDVVEAVSVSRRSLEARFQASVGRTLHQEITRRRINRVCQLLNETDLPLAKIAQRTGDQNEEYMSVAFRRAMNMPPGRYRRGG